jgi:hypothetical protein
MSEPVKCDPIAPEPNPNVKAYEEPSDVMGREIESPIDDVEWYANLKMVFDKLIEQMTQDVTRRNAANTLVDKMDNIFAVHLAESLAIERQDHAARLEKERYVDEALRNKSIDAHYFGMNALYGNPDATEAIVTKVLATMAEKGLVIAKPA